MALPSTGPARPTVEELLAGISKISGHRHILMRLNSVLADDARGAQDLVSVLRLDAGLCARVIAAANSVFFRGGMPIASVDEAVIRVGTTRIRQLLLSSIAFELTAGALKAYGLPPGELWNRSLLCALAMDLLSQQAQRSGDVCYTIGLLHPVGMVVVDRWLSRPENLGLKSLHRVPACELADREREHVGYSSAELGGHLLRAWHFPESIAVAVANQDRPLCAGRFRRLAGLLVVARWLGDCVRSGLEHRRPPDQPDATILRLAEVSIDDACELIAPVRQRFLELRNSLGAA